VLEQRDPFLRGDLIRRGTTTQFEPAANEFHESRLAKHGQHFAFGVDDIDGVCASLAERGVKVSKPMDIPGAGRQAFFRDPSGNLIELNQPRKTT